MTQSLKQEEGLAMVLDEDLMIHSTQAFGRKAGPLVTALALSICLLVFSYSLLAGAIASFIVAALLYPAIVQKKTTFQPNGVSIDLQLYDFLLKKEFFEMSRVTKAYPVRNTGRYGNEDFSVEIVHEKGSLSIVGFLDLAAAEEVASFVRKFIDQQT